MSPERVIPGQVVPADSADDEPSRPQETFLHKVASGPFGAGPRTRTDDDGGANAEADTEVFTVSGAAMAETVEADEVDPAEAELPDAGLPDTDPPDTDPPDTDLAGADLAGADVSVVDAAVVKAGEPGTAEADTAEADTAGAIGAGMAEAGSQTTTDTTAVQARDGRVSDHDEPLLGEAVGRIREEWRQVQASFVDDPRASVTAAAGVTADVAARLESLLRERQRSLLSAGGAGGADTETLRQLMLAYRRLLTKLIS
jgi:hypothetical protein